MTVTCARGCSTRRTSASHSRRPRIFGAAIPRRTQPSPEPSWPARPVRPRDVVLLNAGAALVAAGTAVSVAEGITIAAKSIDEGKASAALDRLVAVSSAAL